MSDSVEQAIETLTQLREAIREAHEITKDLRLEIKEARRLSSGIQDMVNSKIEKCVKEGLTEYDQSLRNAIEKAEKSVSRRFDTLGAIFLGEDPKSVREGKESLEDIIRRVKG